MILVTGGTGLVGSHLLFQLTKAGIKVRATKRTGSDLSQVKKLFAFLSADADQLFNLIDWVDADVTDYFSISDALNGISKIYHCAAVVSFDPKMEKEMIKTNIEGTANLVNAALEHKINKFLHVSSVAAIGLSPDKIITEKTGWKASPQNSVYAISKYGAEREVWRAAEEGLKTVIINPSVILGISTSTKSSSAIFNVAGKGVPVYPSGSSGFVDVHDVVKIMILLMNSEIVNERFIISTENLSYQKLLSLICIELKVKHPKLRAGKVLTGIGWRMDKMRSIFTGTAPVITKEIARAITSDTNFSNEKILKAINFQLTPVRKCIEEVCKFYRKN